MSPELTSFVVKHPSIDFVSFTGSVPGGRSVEQAAVEASGFKGVALELGGKDPAYVRPDAELEYTVGELVDGALFNSGQSCCAVERIYVHEAVYDAFVAKYVKLVKVRSLFYHSCPLGLLLGLTTGTDGRTSNGDNWFY